MSAFNAGYAYALGKMTALMAKGLTYDEAQWITVHPNGSKNKGLPALIDSETGKVLGGMGGTHTGKTISQVKAQKKRTEPERQKKGFVLENVPTATINSKLPDSHNNWSGRDSDGFPEIGVEAEKYHEITAFDKSSAAGAKAEEPLRWLVFSSSVFNSPLRNAGAEGEIDEETKQQIKAIDAYFEDPKHQLKQPIKLLRGISDANVARKMIEAGEFADKGFISATPKKQSAKRFGVAGDDRYIFALNVPKGCGAVSTSAFQLPEESEIVLQRGLKGPINHVEKIANNRGGFDYVAYVSIDPV